MSKSRSEMASHITRLVGSWTRRARGRLDECGRFKVKVEKTEERLNLLRESVSRLSLRGQRAEYLRDRGAAGRSEVKASGPKAQASPVVADRIKFETSPSFWSVPWLYYPALRAAFINPRTARLPPEETPPPPKVQHIGAWPEIKKLYEKWDRARSVVLVKAGHSEKEYRGGLFALWKTALKDRQIVNEKPENSRERPAAKATKKLGGGWQLTEAYVPPPRHQMLGSSEDLSDCYHEFLILLAMALRNHLIGVWRGEDFRGWNCFCEDLAACLVVVCFASLAMGSMKAVEIAQAAHFLLLLFFGAVTEETLICFNRAFPRGPVLHFVVIDDHKSLQIRRRRAEEVPRGLSESMAKGRQGYTAVKLRWAEEKFEDEKEEFEILGGEKSREEIVSAVPLRTLFLCHLTLGMICGGVADVELLRGLVGCWISALLYRMPYMCVLDKTYKLMAQMSPGRVYSLPGGLLDEMLELILLAPGIAMDLRTPYYPGAWVNDASLKKAAVCTTDLPAHVAQEFFRLSERRGFYTFLCGGARALLANWGLEESCPEAVLDQLVLRKKQRTEVRYHWPVVWVGEVAAEEVDEARSWGLFPELSRDRMEEVWHVEETKEAAGQRRPIDPGAKDEQGDPLLLEEPYGGQEPKMGMWKKDAPVLVRLRFLAWRIAQGQVFLLRLKARTEAGRVRAVLLCRLQARQGGYFVLESRWSLAALVVTGEGIRWSGATSTEGGPKAYTADRVEWWSNFPWRERPGGRTRLWVESAYQEVAEAWVGFDAAFRNSRRRTIDDPRWVKGFVQSARWRIVAAYAFRKGGQINTLEGRGTRTMVSAVARRGGNARAPDFMDSRVNIGAWGKGRGATSLNEVLRPAAATGGAANVILGPIHTDTKDNPADDPTRDVELRRPSRPEPRWPRLLKNGDYTAFDQVVKADEAAWPLSGWIVLRARLEEEFLWDLGAAIAGRA